jgi:thioesterase domain-containing protein
MIAMRLCEEQGGVSPEIEIVRLRPDGAEPLIVWIHPIGGGVSCYEPVTRRLPFRSIGVTAPAHRSFLAVPKTIDNMAAAYVDYLRSNKVQDPLVIAGWSMGGLIAFEMANVLRRDGHGPALVVLIDSHLNPERVGSSQLPRAVSRDAEPDAVRAFLLDVLPAPAGETRSRLDAVESCLLAALDERTSPSYIDRTIMLAHQRGLLGQLSCDDAKSLYFLFRDNLLAVRQYHPRACYDGALLSIRGSQTGSREDFRDFATHLVTEEVSGDHYSIIREPAVESTAKLIAASIRGLGGIA